MGVSWIAAVAFGTAVGAQLVLAWWIARIYPTIPPKIPYGTAGKYYFWYGSRAVVWFPPVIFLVLLAWIGGVIVTAPPFVRSQPWFAIPFFLLAATTPVIALSLKDKIDAARRHGP